MAREDKKAFKQAGSYVRRKINQLCSSQNNSELKAALAKLRRGIGKITGIMNKQYDYTRDDSSLELT